MHAHPKNKSWPSLLGCGTVATVLLTLMISSWSHTWAFVFAASVPAIVLLNYFQARISRRRSPKSYGFHVYSEFGPEMRIPRVERIKEVFPNLSDDSVEEWIADFKQVDDLIFRVAKCGGASKLGRAKVRNLIGQRFKWISGMGLKTALFRSDYFAWHDGYDKATPDFDRIAQLFGPEDST
jgi:hypothetical protein